MKTEIRLKPKTINVMFNTNLELKLTYYIHKFITEQKTINHDSYLKFCLWFKNFIKLEEANMYYDYNEWLLISKYEKSFYREIKRINELNKEIQ